MMTVFSGIAGYLLGSFCAAIIVSRALYGSDVRTHGSGNAGATNTARTFGMKAGLLALAGDVLKAVLAALAGTLLAGRTGLYAACAGCFLGHCWPVYYRFRGGKGVAVAAAIACLLDLRMFLILLAVFAVTFALGRRVSLCSVTAAALYPAAYRLAEGTIDAGFWLCCGIAVIVIIRHKENIVRLLNGTEPAFTRKPEKENDPEKEVRRE